MFSQGLDGLQQIAVRLRFHDVSSRAGIERLSQHLRRVVLREYENFTFRRTLPNQAACVQSTHLGHANVQQNNVRIQVLGFFDAFESICRFVDDFPFLLSRQQMP